MNLGSDTVLARLKAIHRQTIHGILTERWRLLRKSCNWSNIHIALSRRHHRTIEDRGWKTTSVVCCPSMCGRLCWLARYDVCRRQGPLLVRVALGLMRSTILRRCMVGIRSRRWTSRKAIPNPMCGLVCRIARHILRELMRANGSLVRT